MSAYDSSPVEGTVMFASCCCMTAATCSWTIVATLCWMILVTCCWTILVTCYWTILVTCYWTMLVTYCLTILVTFWTILVTSPWTTVLTCSWTFSGIFTICSSICLDRSSICFIWFPIEASCSSTFCIIWTCRVFSPAFSRFSLVACFVLVPAAGLLSPSAPSSSFCIEA
jgi:hypothetical protein